jgi:hypothetical protein
MASEGISYDKAELLAIKKAFKVMDDEAIKAAQEESRRLQPDIVKKWEEAFSKIVKVW